MSLSSDLNVYYTKGGLKRYSIEVWHEELDKYQEIRGKNKVDVMSRAREKMRIWDAAWDKQTKLDQAGELTNKATLMLSALEKILDHTLNIDDEIDWNNLVDNREFPVPFPEPSEAPKRPILARFLSSHEERHKEIVNRIESEYQDEVNSWKKLREKFLSEQEERNRLLDEMKASYFNNVPESIVDYCKMVLVNSEYPAFFPKTFELDYNPENRILIVDYMLPSLENIPTLREVRYVNARDEFVEKNISQSQHNKLYDSMIYQVSLRTIHELYEADTIDSILSIVFNGYVETIDRASGAEITPCILSLQAGKEEFESLNLANIDPKICFKSLKGIASSKIHSLTPIAPILQFDRHDSRFITPYDVVNGLSEEDNIAAMDWEDFEHLIRELFEKEFAVHGGEVKVTSASRDRGVDAIAFDPDPIRGGKIVIQAKRYTNTVGVSAVRDLYGTVLNEGAGKGIIVTTSDYGPDAYEFARGKPLVLLSGNNLLHLLEKHGHKGKIDISEAKRIIAEKEDRY